MMMMRKPNSNSIIVKSISGSISIRGSISISGSISVIIIIYVSNNKNNFVNIYNRICAVVIIIVTSIVIITIMIG